MDMNMNKLKGVGIMPDGCIGHATLFRRMYWELCDTLGGVETGIKSGGESYYQLCYSVALSLEDQILRTGCW